MMEKRLKRWSWPRGERGISLTDLLVGMAILVMVLGAAYEVYGVGLDLYNTIRQQSQAESGGRLGLNEMSRYIRECTRITNADDYDLLVKADYDRDGQSDTLRYYVSEGSLYYTVNGGRPVRLAENLVNSNQRKPVFKYLDYEGNTISAAHDREGETRRMVLTLVLDENTSEPPDPVTLETEVQLRNMR